MYKIFKLIFIGTVSCVVSSVYAGGNVFSTLNNQVDQEASQQMQSVQGAQASMPNQAPLPAPTVNKQGTIDKIVAVVNDGIITESELQAKMSLASRDIAQSGLPMPSKQVLRKQVLNNLINIKLQMQLAKRANVHISNKEVDRAISQIAKRNNVSMAVMRDQIQSQGVDFGDFRQQIREQMTIAKVRQGAFGSSITISSKEVQKKMQENRKLTRDEAQNAIYQKKFTKNLKLWLKQLRNSAYVKINP